MWTLGVSNNGIVMKVLRKPVFHGTHFYSDFGIDFCCCAEAWGAVCRMSSFLWLHSRGLHFLFLFCGLGKPSVRPTIGLVEPKLGLRGTGLRQGLCPQRGGGFAHIRTVPALRATRGVKQAHPQWASAARDPRSEATVQAGNSSAIVGSKGIASYACTYFTILSMFDCPPLHYFVAFCFVTSFLFFVLLCISDTEVGLSSQLHGVPADYA